VRLLTSPGIGATELDAPGSRSHHTHDSASMRTRRFYPLLRPGATYKTDTASRRWELSGLCQVSPSLESARKPPGLDRDALDNLRGQGLRKA
jgi:hypothetical protein